jgi:glycine hydroxymethyltransferase
MHVIAAKAVAFQEALQPDYKDYIKSVIANAKILSETLKNNGFKIFSGGTDTHLMLVDLRPFKVTGKDAETSLCKANITCNKNGIPFDSAKPTITSGIRLGSQAATTRGFGLNEFRYVGELITKVIVELSKNSGNNNEIETEVKKEVILLCNKFPIYNHLTKE